MSKAEMSDERQAAQERGEIVLAAQSFCQDDKRSAVSYQHSARRQEMPSTCAHLFVTLSSFSWRPIADC
jgi:hypothetical protein